MYLFALNNNRKEIVKRIWDNFNILKNISQTRVKVITKVSLISFVSKDEMMNFLNYRLKFSWFICNYFVISLHFVGLSYFYMFNCHWKIFERMGTWIDFKMLRIWIFKTNLWLFEINFSEIRIKKILVWNIQFYVMFRNEHNIG